MCRWSTTVWFAVIPTQDVDVENGSLPPRSEPYVADLRDILMS